ncbi:unnamed protein product [Strongylus vulgaris]|uniref:Uncharacterized protein n=1 Tax=Strongylus vulgaris TaxID=40348 RepID=A0A3P7HWJ5_STRVU|nr:unnamed protein product [Strongylus vulgaris]
MGASAAYDALREGEPKEGELHEQLEKQVTERLPKPLESPIDPTMRKDIFEETGPAVAEIVSCQLPAQTVPQREHVIESEDYSPLRQQEKPLLSPTKIEDASSFEASNLEPRPQEFELLSPSLTKGEDISRAPSDEASELTTVSENYLSDIKEQLLSPTNLERPASADSFKPETQDKVMTASPDYRLAVEEKSSVYMPQEARDGEPNVIESKNYFAEPAKSISSPTRKDLPISATQYGPQDHAEDMFAIPDSHLAVKEEHTVYVPSAEDTEPYIIASEDYSIAKEEKLLSSPTGIGTSFSLDSHKPETRIEDMFTSAEPYPLKEEHIEFSLQGEGTKPYIIASEDYAPQLENRLLSSPTKVEELPFFDRDQPKGDEGAETAEVLPTKEAEREAQAELKDYKRIDETRQVSPSSRDISQHEDIAGTEETVDHHSPTQPSLHFLEEEAIENVYKMRFSDTIELESPEQQSAHTPSSYPDEQHSIAGDDEWKVYDNKGEVVEEFSSQLTEELIQEAETNASLQAELSPRKMFKQESSEVTMEPEVDYHSDLQEKLDILAEERREKLFSVEEEEEHLEIIDETEYEHEADRDQEIEQAAIRLVEEAINAVLEGHEETKTFTSTSGSNVYHTATEHSKDEQYDTCVTSQDTYDSAQEWTSQESEYTTAASGATSRLSEAEERQGSVTPLAILSPVDSDRHFTANQDFEETIPVIRHFTVDDTARSTPDVPLQVTIEEEEESEATLPMSPSGVLLAPRADPGRPISPVPPSRQADDDEDYFVFVEKPQEKTSSKTSEKLLERKSTETDTSDSHGERYYTRQLSDISSGSYADTVIQRGKGDMESAADVGDITSTVETISASPEPLDKVSPESSPEEKSGSPTKISDETEERLEKDQTMESPLSEESAKDRTSDNEEGFVICSPIEETPMGEGELETVEEEPEDVESVNGSGNSSVGVPSDTLALVGKYKHVSSDNVSLTSLQEFERLEQIVINHGEGSLSASEIELYAAGKLRCAGSSGSGEGSVSSLAEFEKLEQELTANISPQEEVAMLPEIREESEVEDMSIRDDDEEEHSETEVKTRPIDEEDLRSATPIASPVDSLEHEPIVSTIPLLETSTDSLEPSYERVETHTQRDSEVSSLAEYEVSSKPTLFNKLTSFPINKIISSTGYG